MHDKAVEFCQIDEQFLLAILQALRHDPDWPAVWRVPVTTLAMASHVPSSK